MLAYEGLRAALLSIEEKAPDAFKVLSTHLSAWNEQSKAGALFVETGTAQGGAKPLEISAEGTVNADEFRSAADALVAAGKAKDRVAAQRQLLRSAQGGN